MGRWRASVIPIAAIPVSLIGTFAVLAAFGFSLNNLSLLGLVLAIGIVVDDAIVVVENVERNLRAGMSPREATHRTMDEVGGALVAIALVLSAVFVPAAFIPGISGQFFRQFAVTIAAATILSLFVSLTLSPTLCALLFKEHREQEAQRSPVARAVAAFFRGFNYGFDRLSLGYGELTRRLLRVAALMLVVYAGLIGLAGWQFAHAPTGFIPNQDQGYLITVIQLPPGASLARTDAVVRKASKIIRETVGIAHVVPFAGFDAATYTNAPNAGAIFDLMLPFQERAAKGLSAERIATDLRQRLMAVQEAFIITIPPPPVRGIGTAGGFKMMVQDKRDRGLPALDAATQDIVAAANRVPGLTGVFSLFNTRTPKIYADIDRVRAEMLGVSASRVFETLQVYLGSSYVNDFNYLGRTYRVTAQADEPFRENLRDVGNLKTRNDKGQMVPIGSVASFRDTACRATTCTRRRKCREARCAATRPAMRWRRWSSSPPSTCPTASVSTGPNSPIRRSSPAIPGCSSSARRSSLYFWSWPRNTKAGSLPLAVILIVPMCLLAAVSGLRLRVMDVNILAQVGFVVLVGLAAKNAILIVEFARQDEARGQSRFDAVVGAARTRLRPILMTSFAFVFGVLPLAVATGAGAEMRQSLGTAVVFGMLGITAFGLIFTPVFYSVVRWLFARRREQPPDMEAQLSTRAAE